MTPSFQLLITFLFCSSLFTASAAPATDTAPKLTALKIRKTTEEGGRKRSVDAEIEATDDVGLVSVKLLSVGSHGEVISSAEAQAKGKGVKKARFNLTVDVSDPITSGVRVILQDSAGQTTVLASPKDFKIDLDQN